MTVSKGLDENIFQQYKFSLSFLGPILSKCFDNIYNKYALVRLAKLDVLCYGKISDTANPVFASLICGLELQRFS